MKEQITVYYNKDTRQPNEYIVKRVITQEGKYYSMSAYYMINNKIKEFSNNLKWTSEKLNIYLLLCKKSQFFNKIEYQYVTEETK